MRRQDRPYSSVAWFQSALPSPFVGTVNLISDSLPKSDFPAVSPISLTRRLMYFAPSLKVAATSFSSIPLSHASKATCFSPFV